jgi:hypothetical protein
MGDEAGSAALWRVAVLLHLDLTIDDHQVGALVNLVVLELLAPR